jgi:hypothetical protein
VARVFTMTPMSLTPTSPPFGGWMPHEGRFSTPIFFEDPPTPPAPPAPPTPPAPTPPAPPAPDPNADQIAALQAALDKSKADGTTAALQPLMELVGVTTPEDLQTWITGANEARLAQMSEVERREAAVAAREAAANALEATAQRTIRESNIRSALVSAGAPGETVNDMLGLVAVAEGADETAITAAVEATKTKFPQLFTAAPLPPTPPAPPHRPPTPPAPPGPLDPMAAGRERAKAAAKSRTGATKEDLLNQFTPQRSPLLPTS